MRSLYFAVILSIIGCARLSAQDNKWSISEATFDRISAGMNEKKLLASIGPPGFYFDGTVFFSTSGALQSTMLYYGTKANESKFPIEFGNQTRKGETAEYFTKGWIGNDVGIWVTFHKGVVVSKCMHKVKRMAP